MKDKMDGLEAGRKELKAFLADAAGPPPLLHPKMVNSIVPRCSSYIPPRQEGAEASLLKDGEVLRSLVKEIVVTPEDGHLGSTPAMASLGSWRSQSKPRPRRPEKTER